MSELDKPYSPKETENRIYQLWMDSGYFNPDKLPGKRKKTYTIMIAPPNITGSLHMGHALENTISDILIRFHRMQGFKTLWLPGTDHAGIATQNVVEKDLKKQGFSRHDLGRQKFLEKIWQWREKYGNIILDQLKKLGCSLDWSRTRFTMDPQYQAAVKTAFEHYYKKGLIYQGERVINWCIKDQTALSDLELEYAEEKAKLWHLKYPIKNTADFMIVATTRPETMLGDAAVAVNPKDSRYKNLVGKKVILPIVNREVPIVADRAVDMEFGTGAVKVTPAHDLTDSEIAERNKLPYFKVIDEIGKIINVNQEFNGLKLHEARHLAVEKLKALGLLEKEEEFTHNIARCYRCNSVVEPMLSKQWFVKMKPLAEKTLRAIKDGKINYHPLRWKRIAVEWLQNVRDWCVSRQIWWGHQVPIKGSSDTFDTWFSSALWPFAALGWPEKTKDLKEYYPTTLITSDRGILHLWITRMIFSGLEFMGKAPFKDILTHATILTKDGKRMSKSLGTGIDPLILIEKYGADATRFGLIYQAFGGQDIRFNEDICLMGKKFANKLWNIARYVLSNITENSKNPAYAKASAGRQVPSTKPEPKTDADKDILAKLDSTIKSVTKNIQKYRFGEAAHIIYDFVWHEFADIYIEKSKIQLKNEKLRQNTLDTLYLLLTTILKLLHPFMPFVTEEIWDKFYPVKSTDGGAAEQPFNRVNQKELLTVADWPKI